MKAFRLSRVNTSFGIFRVSGFWHKNHLEMLNIDTIELMGTDGWVLLAQSSDNVIALIVDLTPILQASLIAREDENTTGN
jgi:hypothetical protein